MKVLVYDTYVPKATNVLMHFDILVEEGTPEAAVYEYGKRYLEQKGLKQTTLTTKECKFCHMETAPEPVENAIKEQGYFIIEMEHCN